ncbi:MAG: sigma-54 dependent transcriptional regulator [Candidatus Scalindua rubra]|uniref:Transcriptional regulator n=1 Tax=Candidatus Scalindua brodae TaxID=237368 RepID=A0A0B0EK60_9BACT|nr:MAG: transcriptional regulator [Candidatus Scalindua brodae]MBZ0108142.1 sigma-54 dependent transcriptional regulator [Candidatus Scalindua rubra]TWU31240.1 Transcriptional regulatory protein QseF [Candidatus Brocadiaceae bacterium S225]
MKNSGSIHECKWSFDKHDLQRERDHAKAALKREFALGQILGNSKAIKNLKENLIKISSCDVNVLITGESGTGKELVARATHYLSDRKGKPFIPVNCGAIPENLFENELFGHSKGAYTDAGIQQDGLVKEAEGGTLFLDEIGTVNPFIQTKLLRLIQESEYRPLGYSKSIKANIRLLAATNIDLHHLVEQNTFREDLFYRLNVVPFHIPPLRERKGDIPILIKHFIKKYSREYNKAITVIPVEVMSVLVSYSWPGNIRELENKIQQLVVMSTSSVVNAKDIQLTMKEPISKELVIEHLNAVKEKIINQSEIETFNVAKKKVNDLFEKTYLTQLLRVCKGDMVNASKKAGKSRTAFWNLLKKQNLSPKQFR